MSLKPVCGSRASGAAELKLAVWRRGSEAVPWTLTEEHGLLLHRPHTGYSTNEAADDLALAAAFGGPSLQIGTGRGVMSHPHDRHDVEGAVGGSVATAAEAMAAGGAGRDRGHRESVRRERATGQQPGEPGPGQREGVVGRRGTVVEEQVASSDVVYDEVGDKRLVGR